jgi:membrane-associated protease RseP (regulator of RpoE activity)
MFLPFWRFRPGLRLRAMVLALAIGGISGSSAFAQGGGGLLGGIFRGGANMGGYGNRGYYPYYGNGSPYNGYPGYNIYGNYGVYGYPGSGIEGGYSNPGYDPGFGGYPSYGGLGITNRNPNAAPAASSSLNQRRLLGIDEEPVVIAGGVKAMKVGKVYPGTAAEKAGLHAGDVIRSVNGYLTEQRGNLAWIIANAAPSNELKLNVQTANDNQTHLITATLR